MFTTLEAVLYPPRRAWIVLIVIGGGTARSSFLFLSAAQNEFDDLNIHLQVSALKDRAPLAGAAVAWFNGSDDAIDPSAQAAVDTAHFDALQNRRCRSVPGCLQSGWNDTDPPCLSGAAATRS